jgi:hypothetical protein
MFNVSRSLNDNSPFFTPSFSFPLVLLFLQTNTNIKSIPQAKTPPITQLIMNPLCKPSSTDNFVGIPMKECHMSQRRKHIQLKSQWIPKLFVLEL